MYQFEGALNKFLMDDKGSTLIAVWGLPPLSHDNDPTRGVIGALALCKALSELDLTASCGVSTGACSHTNRMPERVADSMRVSACEAVTFSSHNLPHA